MHQSRWDRSSWGLRDLPPNSRLTAALLVLWIALAIYIVWTGNTLGYIILALVSLFVFVPALVVWLGTRRGGGAGGTEEVGRRPEDEEQRDAADGE